MVTAVLELSPEQMQQVSNLSTKFGTDEETALSRALELADYIVDTANGPESKLLVEQDGKFTRLTIKR